VKDPATPAPLRIAVTGAAGYIGGWLCRELDSRGHDVWAQDRRPPGGVSDWGTWHTFDVADGPARAGWLERCKPDVVVHLAALYGRVWGEADLAETARVNAGLAAALARDVAAAGARLMYVSSSEAYGAAAGRGPVDEASPLEPLNMYGLSKKWGEEGARLYAPEGLVVARLNMPYGPPVAAPEPETVPETSAAVGGHGYNVLHTMLWQASHGKGITVHRGAERCMTWIGDAVAGLAMIIESGRAGTWNVCRDDDHLPVAEIARRAVALAGSSSRVTEEDPPARVTLRKRLDAGPLLALGWRPAVSLDDGMARSLAHYSRYDENGAWRG
jgi:nucleoside-diphosphate-sugar epimerase